MTASPPAKPAIIPPKVKAIPYELRELPAWVCWRLEWRTDSNGKGSWTKVPINARTGGNAASNDPSTWSTFDEAAGAYKRLKCDGIGLCRTGNYMFIDLDGVLNENGNIRDFAWANNILDVVEERAYIEQSVSGTGLHIICKGRLPAGRRKWEEPGQEHTGFEFSDGNRYFTFTGVELKPCCTIGLIHSLTDEFEQLYTDLFPKAPPKPIGQNDHRYWTQAPNGLSDSDLIEKARRASNGAAFSRLWGGDITGYPSQSEADMALCCHLAWWTGKDSARIDALFRQSGLFRDKWDRVDYRDRTIDAAIEKTTDSYDPNRGKAAQAECDPPENGAPHPADSDPPDDDHANAAGVNGAGPQQPKPKPGSRRVVVEEPLSMAELRARKVEPAEMLIEEWLTLRGLTLLVGAPRSGKTVLVVHMAACVVQGRPLFDHYRVKQGPAMILEQDDQAGPDALQQIAIKAGLKDEDPIKFQKRLAFGFGKDFLDWAGDQITKYGLKFLGLDSYTALRPSRGAGVDIVKAEQTDLAALDNLSKQTGCAIPLIHHSSKGSAALDWNERAGGTYAMTASSEGQIFISRFQELDGGPERLVRARMRQGSDAAMVLKFREETLDYEVVIDGLAAPHYPLVLRIQEEFSNRPFTPKDFYLATGASKATAFRQIELLRRVGVLKRHGRGEYSLADLR
jgi:hypothetical protein